MLHPAAHNLGELNSTLRAADSLSSLPMNELRRQASERSTTIATRSATNVVHLVTVSQIISDYCLFKHHPIPSLDLMISRSCRLALGVPPMVMSSRYKTHCSAVGTGGRGVPMLQLGGIVPPQYLSLLLSSYCPTNFFILFLAGGGGGGGISDFRVHVYDLFFSNKYNKNFCI